MNIFNLRDHVINDYHQYVESFLNIRDERIRDFVSGEPSKGVLRKVNQPLRIKEPWIFDDDKRLIKGPCQIPCSDGLACKSRTFPWLFHSKYPRPWDKRASFAGKHQRARESFGEQATPVH